MTAPTPTGRLVGNDLRITRTFRAPIEDVWTSVTDSDSTARWYGTWKWVDQVGPGNLIAITMLFEQGAPTSNALVERCDAPRHFAITSKSDYGDIAIELTLAQVGDTTTMTFVHHLTDRTTAGDFGPGWEYYFDMLVDAREGRPLRKFEEYYPAQKQYFLDQI